MSSNVNGISGINLKTIANKFSGMILFSGDGAVEIKECNNFYIFPTDEELNDFIEGDGERPKFITIYKWYEKAHGDEVLNFDMYKLQDVESRCDFKIYETLEYCKEFFDTLSPVEKEYFIKQLQKKES